MSSVGRASRSRVGARARGGGGGGDRPRDRSTARSIVLARVDPRARFDRAPF